MGKEEKLVVEVVAAHNLMPKDGQGSSSPYVEVEFEHQNRRTGSRSKELNPVWNEKLVFPISDPEDLPYRAIDVGVYNEKVSGPSSRNFLGRVRIPAAGIPAPGEEAVPQLFVLEKRSLFSHIRGEISLKIYRVAGGRDVTPSPAREKRLAKVKQGAAAQEKAQLKKAPVVASAAGQPPVTQKPVAPAAVPVEPVMEKPVVVAAGAPAPAMPVPHLSAGPVGTGGGHDFALKETHPHLGGGIGGIGGRDKTSSTYDLVEQVQYLYVRVVRARDLPLAGAGESSAEVKLGNYRGVTRPAGSHHWDQVFAFSKDTIQSSVVDVFVKERDRDEPIGRLAIDLSDVPRRVPPDSSLAPQWYRLEDPKKGGNGGNRGEAMVAVWFGTQADEAFAEAWHSRAAGVPGNGIGSIKSKVYVAPKLWYLRVAVLEAQDLLPGEKGAAFAGGRYPDLFAKAQVGTQVQRTRSAPVLPNRPPSNPAWNEDLLFVVAEPFDDLLLLTVEDRIGPNRDEVLGRAVIPVSGIERRYNDKPVASRWLTLDLGQGGGPGRFGSRVHLRLSLDGGYHVLDETTAYSSDLRPTAKPLWPPPVGILELGILGAAGLMPMKARDGKGGTADAYCVAKYGQKWIRTRTVVDSTSPRWNEQYTWEVFDPCTVVTIGVFDNCHFDGGRPGAGPAPRDSRVGKVRIRLSTLESDRVYTHAYPLLLLHPSGVKKMGELHLAVRLSCASAANMLHAYLRPLLPKMHYSQPLLVRQVENLRYQATGVLAARLARAEPPLGREVVEYMLDHGSHLWSMRRSKASFFRLVSVLSGAIAAGRYVEAVRSWHRPVRSVLFALAYVVFVSMPELILPAGFLAMAVAGLWLYRARPRHPPHMDTRLSHTDAVYADELDEEFDTFPTSRGAEVVRMRYDRLRSVAGRVQTVAGDLASQGERAQALLSWRDPRATLLFLGSCVAAAVLLYAVPLKAVVLAWGLYALRPPRFRSRLPSPAMSFFRRLPTKADTML